MRHGGAYATCAHCSLNARARGFCGIARWLCCLPQGIFLFWFVGWCVALVSTVCVAVFGGGLFDCGRRPASQPAKCVDRRRRAETTQAAATQKPVGGRAATHRPGSEVVCETRQTGFALLGWRASVRAHTLCVCVCVVSNRCLITCKVRATKR